MKKAILVLAISTIAFSCSKKKDDPQPVTPTPVVQTTLSLTVVDELGNPMPNVSVDFRKRTGASATFNGSTSYETISMQAGKTNSSGTFSAGVEPNITVYYAIEAGECLEQNSSSISGTTNPNTNNVATVVMKKKIVSKTLIIRNTTSATQTTYLDGIKLKDLGQNELVSVSVLSGETYTVKFVFKDMPSITPTTETIKIECDKNNVVTF